jgi:hypothetical protein
MKLLQFQVMDTTGAFHTINSESPLTFEYANTLLSQMGVGHNVKKITFIGYLNFSFD